MNRGAFEGVKIADFSWLIAGPLATKYMADYGATVVRVESKKVPDFVRIGTPFKDGKPGLDRAFWFVQFNSSKLSLSLNLNNPKGIEVAKRLIAWADVVVENFTPGIMQRWGLGYADLRKLNPSVIMLSMGILGQTGPQSRQPGHGTVLTAFAGLNHLTGWPDRGPVEVFGAYTDFLSPPLAVGLLAGALDYRRRTGKGQYLDLSQFEAALHYVSPLLLDYRVNGRSAGRTGNRSSRACPHGAYRCSGEDRWCVIAVRTEEEWRSLCLVMGNPGWAADHRFSTMAGRMKHEAELDRLIESWTTGFSAEEVMHRLQAAGVPAGVVKTTADMRQDPQMQHRGHFVELDHPVIGRCDHYSPAFTLSKTLPQLRSAPCMGQHSERVCKELLGMTDEAYCSFVNAGAFD